MNVLMKYLLLCFLLLLTTLKCSCQRYYPVENLGSNLCENSRSFIAFITQSINKYDIHLDRTFQSIVIEKRFNISQIKRLKSDCKFTIDTKIFGKNSGIYVNILKMKMRRVRLTGVCIDSIVIKFNEKVKRRFCGELEAGEIKSVEDNEGKVKITISIDRTIPFDDPEDYVEFQVVATAFKDCQDLDQEFTCKKNSRKSCISSAYTNDTIVNCNEPFCGDEKLGCIVSSTNFVDVQPQRPSDGNVAQIFLSAIISLILTMLCCGGFVYVIFKIKRCCFPQASPQTTTRIHRRRRRNNHSDGENPASTPDSTPSAPPKDDLPPSYSVLFPERVKEEAPNT